MKLLPKSNISSLDLHDFDTAACDRSNSSRALMDLSISKFGETEYVFSESGKGHGCAALRYSEKSKWGISTQVSVSVGDHLIQNVAYGVLPVGAGKQRICMNCYLITKAIKVRADCTSFSFCSQECMKNCGSFLDECGTLINTLRDWDTTKQSFDISQYSDVAVLAVVLLYKCMHSGDKSGLHRGINFFGIQNYQLCIFQLNVCLYCQYQSQSQSQSQTLSLVVNILQRLEKHNAMKVPELSELASILFAQLQQYAPSLMSECMNTAAHVEKLLRLELRVEMQMRRKAKQSEAK